MIRSAFHLTLGQIGMAAVAIVLTGVIGRALGPSDFGLWYLLSTTTTFVLVFVDWGYGPYIVREVAREPRRAGELLGTVLVVRAVTTLAAALPAAFVMHLLGYSARICAFAVLLIVTSIPVLFVTSWGWAFRGRERMDFDAMVNVVLKALTLALTVALLATGLKLAGIILAQCAGALIALFLAIRLYRKLGLPKLSVDMPTAKQLVRDAAPMFTMTLMITLQPYIDANLLTKLAPAVAVGWYGAAANLAGSLLAPAVILVAALYPQLCRAAADRAEFNRLATNALRTVVFVSMLGSVGTYLFADVAIQIVYAGRGYAPAGDVLRAFAPALFLCSVDCFLGNVVLAAGRVGLFARAKAGALVVTTALVVLLIPICQHRFGSGGVGVMLACNGGELVMLGAALWLIPHGTLDRGAAADFLRSLVAAATTILVIRVVPAPPFVAMPLAVAVYTAAALAIGLVRSSDLEMIKAAIARKRSLAVAQPTVSVG